MQRTYYNVKPTPNTRPCPGSSGSAPAWSPAPRGLHPPGPWLLGVYTRPVPGSSGSAPSPFPGSPAAEGGLPAPRPGPGPRRTAGPGWPGSRREGAAHDTHLHDSLLQPVVHEPRGPGLHRASGRPQPGRWAPRAPGSSPGCPRRSPGRPLRLLPPARRPGRALALYLRCPTASEENATEDEETCPHPGLSGRPVLQACPAGPGCQGPLLNTLNFIVPRCADTGAWRLLGLPASVLRLPARASGSDPSLREAAMVLAATLANPEPGALGTVKAG